MNLTSEQQAAIAARGKTIVSASAGSGKTFVMIEKLVNAVVGGVDLDDVLAVTFTKKAAAQMKEKLRLAIVKRLDGADDEEKGRLKTQLSKIPSSNISTIHSFCARLLRIYFYALGIDSGFEIISSDDAVARDLKTRAVDSLFEELYESGDSEFSHLLGCYMRKRSDFALRRLVDESYGKVRSVAHYRTILSDTENLYTEEGFQRVVKDCEEVIKTKIDRLICAVNGFEKEFYVSSKGEVYAKIFSEMRQALETCKDTGLFEIKPPLTVTGKPRKSSSDAEEDIEAGEAYSQFRTALLKKYNALYSDIGKEEEERKKFFESGKTAAEFARLLLRFDAIYAAVKGEENKLDYNDLEHLTLELLSDGKIREEINSAFKYVYVDEYQDVNPVQEEIISSLSGESFLVGDVKQAIYGFRGSKSVFFSDKFKSYESYGGNSLKLSSNFRSADKVLDFVNAVFSDIMQESTNGINYKNTSQMLKGGQYPGGYGSAEIHIIGKDEPEERTLGVYSVKEDGRTADYTKEGLAVLAIVEKELKSKHYDLKKGMEVDTERGDICILTRKNKGGSTEGIVRALTDAGYTVAGAQEPNICNLPEVKQMLDILSLIDNEEQDMPLVTALLSPLGKFTEDELAKIRIAADGREKERKTFRQCCRDYARIPGEISNKLNIFRGKLEKLRALSDILSAAELIDELLENYDLESGYGAGGEQKVKNVLALSEGGNVPLSVFLENVRSGGFDISAPSPAPSDSIKIMTMHSSKGLEFPVVIIADICKTFKGTDYEEMPFDEKYSFAPKCYDKENMLVSKTLLRRLVKMRADSEELKNEMNLFYVACTRAMCKLHILAEEVPRFDESRAAEAKCYADMFDLSKFAPLPAQLHSGLNAEENVVRFIYSPDPAITSAIEDKFEAVYPDMESIDLPIKSSASAILRMYDDNPHFAHNNLFGGEGETSTDKGTAYHKFLELCDFSKKSREEIEGEIKEFVNLGKIDSEAAALLDGGELAEILSMPVFSDLNGAELFREREFLCRLPANEIMPTSAEDGVLIQGAIDLMAAGSFGVKIVDYKYSVKSDEELIKTYEKQLKLYKKAVSIITKTNESKIETVIVNIHLRRQINLK